MALDALALQRRRVRGHEAVIEARVDGEGHTGDNFAEPVQEDAEEEIEVDVCL